MTRVFLSGLRFSYLVVTGGGFKGERYWGTLKGTAGSLGEYLGRSGSEGLTTRQKLKRKALSLTIKSAHYAWQGHRCHEYRHRVAEVSAVQA